MLQKDTPSVISSLWLVAVAAILVLVYLVQPYFQNSFPGALLSGAFIALILVVFVFYCVKAARGWLDELKFTGRDRGILLIVGIGILVAGCVAITLFFRQEKDIKIYDFATFWINTVEVRTLIDHRSIHESLAAFLRVLAMEYTYVPALPLALASYVFGLEYDGYCQAIFILYYFPTCLFISILAMRLVRRARKYTGHSGALSLCLCLCLLNAGMVWPLVNGYVDVVGALFVMIMMNMTLDWDGTELDWKKILVLAVLGCLAVLARRFYAFYIVGFFSSFGVALIVDMIVTRRYSLWRLYRLVRNMVIIAATVCLIFVILNPALFHVFLGVDYAQAYSAAFKHMTSWQNITLHARQEGLLWFLFSCLGAYFLFTIARVRLLCFRIILAPVIAFILFRRVQDMNNHHAYIIISAMALFLCVFVLLAVDFIRARRSAWSRGLLSAAAGFLFILYIFNFLLGFDPRFSNIADRTQPVTTTIRSYPKTLASYDTIMALSADLKERIGDSPKRVYMGTVSPLLSPDYILRSEMPAKTEAVHFMLRSNNVDLRDWFPSQAFLADYMVFQYPYFQEFSAQQETVYQLFDLVVNSELGQEYYRLEKTYPLPDDNEVRLYRKTRETTPELVDELKNRVQKFYPENPEVYTPSHFVAFATVFSPADFTVYTNPNDIQFYFQKRDDSDATVHIGYTGDFSTLSFRLNSWVPNMELVVKNQDGEIYRERVGEVENREFAIDVAGSEYFDLVFTDADPENRATGFLMLLNPKLAGSE